ncbi:MAG: class IV adenylate cyclase [bacterium]|nr:class IV adenylate cyclase [bacterium]
MKKHINIEIKALSKNHDRVRKILNSKKADFLGTDHQVDTYFKVSDGRLKLREVDNKNHLIYYTRENKCGPKQSNITRTQVKDAASIKEILEKALEVLTVVDKQREIYSIDNVRFHIDTVRDLGTFIEIEAVDDTGKISKEVLYDQCQKYMKLFGIPEKDLVELSYSDLILEKS